jgi:hypothetical protein
VENVLVFSLWYWQVDRGGPAERAAGSPIPPSATAFSPTDTLPVRRWAKLTMMQQSALSLVIAILVIARAINVPPG